MHFFDAVVGNPPYQIATKARSASNPQAMPLYNIFAKKAFSLAESVTMIIPSRWMTTDGWGLKEFRMHMAKGHLPQVHDFENSEDCFNGIKINGGVCYFLWKRNYFGDCFYVEHHSDGKILSAVRPLIEGGMDIAVRRKEALSVLKCIADFNESSVSSIVHTKFCFNLTAAKLQNANCKNGDVEVYGWLNGKRSVWRIQKKFIARESSLVDQWKVYIPKASGFGRTDSDRIVPFIGRPGTASTDTYSVAGPFECKEECESFISYISTKTVHYLVGIRKNTQDCLRGVFSFVPMQDFKSGLWTDRRISKKYSFSEGIESLIDESVWPEERNAFL